MLTVPSSCLVNEHTGWGVLAAASVLLNFLMRNLFPVFPNCPALFSPFGSFSSSSFHHAPFILSFKLPHHPFVQTRTCLTRLRTGWPQFSPFIRGILSLGGVVGPTPLLTPGQRLLPRAGMWHWCGIPSSTLQCQPGPLSVTVERQPTWQFIWATRLKDLPFTSHK